MTVTPPPVSHERRYDAMTKRRDLGLRTFVGWVTLVLLLVRGAFDLHVKAADVSFTRILLQLLVAGTYLLLAGMMIQIEIMNSRDRIHYTGEPQPFLTATRRAWATTWPLAGGAVIAVVACLLFHVLPIGP